MKRLQATPRGFSLLEVLVALAIFVGSVAALSRLVLLGVENAEYSRWQAEAMMIAECRLAELQSGILTVNSVGTYPSTEAVGWQWTMSATSEALTGLYRVQFEIKNISGGPGDGFFLRVHRLYFDETAVEQATTDTTTAEAAP
ncbi:MAG: prepilin-type N-terminal cleavage/methylation domain-containing protein [Planctomycetota bacterium]